mmetsp:Transcript_21765/g.47810  ORF Transcript_21765/g.47810 Transcript_21765/m.47810 type:complete len:441 (-) Transcript_21765:140-1462(-)
MLALGQLLVQTPEDLHNTKGGCRDRIGEVATRGRHSPNDGDAPLASWAAQASHLTRTLVKGGETGAKICGVSAVCRHFCQATGNLTKGLGPTRCGVRHHTEVVALVTEVLRQRDTGVDGSLASCHGHVGGVRHQRCTLHDRLLRAVFKRHGESGEVHQHLSHLITALTASHVDNAIGVGVLGQCLANHGLATAERSRDGAGPAKHGGEQCIQHTLSSEQRVVSHHLLSDGSGLTHRPVLQHVEGLLLSLELNLNHSVQDRVFARSSDLRHTSVVSRGKHHAVLNQAVLLDGRVNIAPCDRIPNFDVRGLERPLLGAVQSGHVHTTWNEAVTAHLCNLLQWTLNTVENVSKHAGAQFHTKRSFGAQDGMPDFKTGGLLVTLNGGSITLQPDNLADELTGTYAHQLVHRRTGHVVRHHHRPRHLLDAPLERPIRHGARSVGS